MKIDREIRKELIDRQIRKANEGLIGEKMKAKIREIKAQIREMSELRGSMAEIRGR